MLNVLSLFSGIGAFEKALENLGIPHNVLAYCEIDKYASKAYSIIHNISEEKNLKDVTQVDILDIEDRVDLITYGFPCQDISNAGKQKGFTDENGERTRSGLFFEALRIIDDYRPKFAIAENVKALVSKKFSEEFKTVLESLEEIGYNNYYAVLNAKDFGIPQNRERVFIISIRKDIDKGFEFPDPIPLELKLKDLLEDEVDEKFYLTNGTLDKLVVNMDPKTISGVDKSTNKPRLIDTANCITSREDRGISNRKAEGTAIVEPIQVKEATKKGYAEATEGDSINLEQPNSKTRRGRVGNKVAQTLTTSCNQAVVINSKNK
jgi:DNA (cytosine-5)-methyltransferase 1